MNKDGNAIARACGGWSLLRLWKFIAQNVSIMQMYNRWVGRNFYPVKIFSRVVFAFNSIYTSYLHRFSAPIFSGNVSIWTQFPSPNSSSLCHMTPHFRDGNCTHREDLALSCVGGTLTVCGLIKFRYFLSWIIQSCVYELKLHVDAFN